MRVKKGKLAMMLAAGLLAAMCLSACGSGGGQGSSAAESGQGQAAGPGNENRQAGYLFQVNGVSIGVDMDMNELRAKLGEPKSIFESPSCAAQGTAYVYSYASYEIETYPDGEKNRIAYLILKDDMVATPEGIDLSKTKADILKAYGEGGREEGNRLTYEKDGMKLNFILEGDNIVSIEYVSGAL